MPKIVMEKEPTKLIRYMSDEHFAAIYEACDVATRPAGMPYTPAEWWRALLMFAYMTGWRVGEPLSLLRADLDLKAGKAITRAEDNKGGRDESVPLHPVVVEHLERLASFEEYVFPWPHSDRILWTQFEQIQRAAGIDLPCQDRRKHTCTRACHTYGFHDLRRTFATKNRKSMTGDELQKMMRHKSYTTTQLYMNMDDQLADVVTALHVPKLPKVAAGA